MASDTDNQAVLYNALRRIAGDPALSVLLHRILERCAVHGPSPTEKREGERAIGIWLLEQMDDADPGIFIRLCGERARDEIQRRQDAQRQQGGQ